MGMDLASILRLQVPVVVRLGERDMTYGAVMSRKPGSIIELSKGADEELDLLINNKHIGYGSAVKVGENFGIRITFVGDVRERIEALGPDDPGALETGDTDQSDSA